MEAIQSRQNPLIKQCIKLASQRRERLKSGYTLLDGPHLIAAALDNRQPPERLLVAESSQDKLEISALLQRYRHPAVVVADALFAELTELESASGLIGIWPIPHPPALSTRGLVLALDAVQDPGNVGTILRTAAAAGVEQVWLGMGSADAWSPKVLRAGMGAHFVLPVIERVELAPALAGFRGKAAVLTLDGSESLFASDLRGDFALVMGSEGLGVSAEVAERAALRLRIPMRAGVESLNVGAATAICLYERLRQSGGAAA